ncbi:YidH family protein [Escherichia coli]|uniref:YidH family protein n=1 Tax=Escherichia coli TaxID=562 RepID=UPI000E68710B|nr:DUF202 domain-containing protein [Escherichia coli]MCB3584250.1 DUF202 domain-containing protein [Klebsiella pneumoniae]MCB3612284.1 DUF202 domain-containing protein [Klebsiella pneumoniae]RIW06394.1 DUF202 domain-containing protein [Escherichia coli]HBZ1364738.1 DUF202 domain-containing protein [Klebsiella pneumoniae]HCB0391689.1 DUF202 domain-containing protein [Klebsiella pneumoniae]
MKILQEGEAPDYRFSLANERTFLAWIRTALGFLAAGVALEQLGADFTSPLPQNALSVLLILLSGVIAFCSFFRWITNEHAMRMKRDLPYSKLLLVVMLIMILMPVSYLLTILYD